MVIASLISLIRHWSYDSWTFDLGAFSQSLYSTIHGDLLYNTPCGMSQLGYHFQPILFLLVPVFWLAPYAETLLIVQSIGLGFGGYLVYKLARTQQLSHNTSLFVEVVFLLSPLVHGVNFFDFHPVAFAVPTLLIMLIGLIQQRWVIFTIGLVLSLLTKEDVIIALGVFGVVMLLGQYFRTKKVERVYLVILFCSIAAYGVAVVVANLSSGAEGTPMLDYGHVRYSYIEQGPGGILSGALAAFFSRDSMLLLFSYFLPLAFLPLLSPLWAAPALFILAGGMLTTTFHQKTLHQYPAAAIPFLFMALIAVLSRDEAREALHSIPGRVKMLLPIGAIIMLLGLNLMLISSPDSPIKDVNMPDSHDKAIDAIIKLIPDNTTVTASNHIFSHLCTRTMTYSPYEPEVPNRDFAEFGLLDVTTEYVIIDLRRMRDYRDGHLKEGIDWGVDYIEGNYGLLAHIDGISLLQQGYTGTPMEIEVDNKPGFNATIYSDSSFENKVVEAQYFSAELPHLDIGGVIPGIVPKDSWSISFTGYLNVPTDSTYDFHLRSDEYATLIIDNEVIFGPGVVSNVLSVSLDKGIHEIELRYAEHVGGGYLNLDLKGLSVSQTPT